MFFPSLVAYMSSGPILVLILARESAISFWRQLIGPTNTQKARDQAPERYLMGLIFANDCRKTPFEELQIFGPLPHYHNIQYSRAFFI